MTAMLQIIAPLAAALILTAFLAWTIGKRTPSGHPLGLPEGSVRAMLGVAIIYGTLLLVAFHRDVPPELWAAFGLVLGLYFGGRSSGPAAAPTRREPAGGSTAGFARLGIMLTIAGAGAAMLMLTTGCATILRPVQKGVDVVAEKVAGQKGKDLVAGFRDAEGQIYVDANGYIATSNMTKTVAIYAVDEARWITGRVQAVETFVRYQTPIGPAPAAPQAPSAPPPPAAPPTTQPGAGPSEIPLLKGPTTGGVTL